jgi:hypothetical protein
MIRGLAPDRHLRTHYGQDSTRRSAGLEHKVPGSADPGVRTVRHSGIGGEIQRVGVFEIRKFAAMKGSRFGESEHRRAGKFEIWRFAGMGVRDVVNQSFA